MHPTSTRAITALVSAACLLLLLLVLAAPSLSEAPYRTGTAQPLPRPIRATLFTGAFALNEALTDSTRHVATGLVPGQETPVIEPATGLTLLFDEDGWMHRLHANGTFVHRDWYTGGRILGGAFLSRDVVVACDVGKGLVQLTLSTRDIRVLAAASDDGVPILYPNDVAVSRRTGRIYFSDAAAIAPWRKSTGGWATLEGSFITMFSGRATGRLLCFDPVSRTTTTLARDLIFANGVALSADESFVLVAQTFALAITRVWLGGPRAGVIEDFVALHMPPDGISLASDGGFWVALPTSASLPFALAGRSVVIRTLLGRLPSWCWPRSQDIGAVVKLDATGAVVGALYDPKGTSVSFVSSVHEYAGELYLGQLRGNSLPVVPVPHRLLAGGLLESGEHSRDGKGGEL